MKLKELINKSTYCSTGHISCQEDIDKLEQYILYNLPVLKQFQQVWFINNYKDANGSIKYSQELVKIYKKYNFGVTHRGISKGHSFGAAENDNFAIELVQNTNWVCKSAHDMILDSSILEKEIEEADFYYLNGIGYGGMEKYNYDFNRIINEDFYPQTNFYFINKSKIDYLNNKEYINETYNQLINIPNFNGKPWEYIDGWACEEFLKQCVLRNNLKIEHLICQDSYLKLLELVKNLNIHDNSHKNIMIDGICHFHNHNEQIYKINN